MIQMHPVAASATGVCSTSSSRSDTSPAAYRPVLSINAPRNTSVSSLPPCAVFSHVPERWLWDVEKGLAAEGVMHISWKSRLLWPLTELTHADFPLRHADRVWAPSAEHVDYIANPMGVPREPI